MLGMKSSESSKKEGLYGALFQSIDQRFGDSEETPPFYEWVQGINLDGRPFSFDKHEYLREPYQDTHPDQTFMKAAQLGLTTLGMLRALYGARYRGFNGVLYLFPSRSDVSDFSKSRIAPLLDDNEDTIGSWVTDTDSVNIKRVHRSFLYFRGMRSRTGLKSIPIDYLILDELEEVPDMGAIDMAKERLAHSEFQEILKLSNPRIPDYGIDKFFQETDQRFYLLKCPRCGAWTDLVETFPDTLHEIKGGVIRACRKCGAELNIDQGEWVAKRPDIKHKRGYQFSQLYSYYIDPADILNQFRTTAHPSEFWNLKIGLPYIEAENRLTVEEVLALCGNKGIAGSSSEVCSMGVDQGKDLHVVIGKKCERAFGEILHINVYRDWGELDRLMKNFKVGLCVVDALPETRNARAFAERHKGKVYLNYYNEHQKGSYAWNEAQMIVQCNRTESLDASHKEIMEEALFLPKRCEMTELFAQHCHNVAKKLEEDEETGSKRYVYVKLGPDHFRHAYNYECMARSNLPQYVFPELH